MSALVNKSSPLTGFLLLSNVMIGLSSLKDLGCIMGASAKALRCLGFA